MTVNNKIKLPSKTLINVYNSVGGCFITLSCVVAVHRHPGRAQADEPSRDSGSYAKD